MSEKVIVACSSCATQYNVATLQPGAKFKCQKCGNINVVPVQAAPQPAPRPPRNNRDSAAAPQPRPMVRGAKPPTAIRPPVKGMGIKASGLRKGLPTRKPAEDSEDEGINGLEVKKKSKMPLFIGIGIGVVILVVVVIAMSSGGGTGDEEAAMLKKVEAEAREKEKEKAEAEASKKSEEEKKSAEEKPAPEMRKTAPEAKKSSKPKIKDDIDEAVKTEIEPILKDMRNQRDIEPSKEKIMAKGKKAIPILIEAVGGDDEWAAMYAYEILIKLTKRNRDDTTKVTQMLNKDMRRDCQKDWEDWWFKTKDSIPD